MKQTTVSKEVALDDLENFVNAFSKKPVERNKLEDSYPDVLDGIMDGFVSFDADTNIPKLMLKNPIKDEEAGEVVVKEINFRTRISPTVKASLGKGLVLQTDILTYQLKVTSYIIDQPLRTIDKFSAYDYDIISQIASVFP